jgi:hypothetical protein
MYIQEQSPTRILFNFQKKKHQKNHLPDVGFFRPAAIPSAPYACPLEWDKAPVPLCLAAFLGARPTWW